MDDALVVAVLQRVRDLLDEVDAFEDVERACAQECVG